MPPFAPPLAGHLAPTGATPPSGAVAATRHRGTVPSPAPARGEEERRRGGSIRATCGCGSGVTARVVSQHRDSGRFLRSSGLLRPAWGPRRGPIQYCGAGGVKAQRRMRDRERKCKALRQKAAQRQDQAGPAADATSVRTITVRPMPRLEVGTGRARVTAVRASRPAVPRGAPDTPGGVCTGPRQSYAATTCVPDPAPAAERDGRSSSSTEPARGSLSAAARR